MAYETALQIICNKAAERARDVSFLYINIILLSSWYMNMGITLKLLLTEKIRETCLLRVCFWDMFNFSALFVTFASTEGYQCKQLGKCISK